MWDPLTAFSDQTHVPMQNQNMPHNEETVDIAANVLWECVTKTVHPVYN